MADVIKVVVIARSPLMRCLIASFLRREIDIHVVSVTSCEDQALYLINKLKPNVIILALSDGLCILDHIMHEFPTPIIAINSKSEETTIQSHALELGAVDLVYWNSIAKLSLELLRFQLIEKVRSVSRVRVIRSLRSRKSRFSSSRVDQSDIKVLHSKTSCQEMAENVIIIGASTGGPTALRTMLKILPSNFPSPIIIVQHMPEGYTAALATQLNDCANISVREATDGCRLEKSIAVVAPGNWHLHVDSDYRVRLTMEPAVGGHRPSVDVTMESAAKFYGQRAIGVVLTGMGSDGANGLQAIHDRGGKTFAQESKSCVVDGMPKSARETGIVDYTATPSEIAQQLIANLK